MEYKFFSCDVKQEGEGQISGYGSVFDSVDEGNDLIVKGAFDKSLASGRHPKMLWQHSQENIIGVWNSVKVDDHGLKLKGTILQDVAKGAEALTLLKAGALDGLSIGYRTKDYAVDAKTRIRSLKEVDLFEISLVTFPMNTEATVTDVKQLQSPREVEQLLRKAGVPVSFAKLLALHGYEEAIRRLGDHCDDDDEAKAQAAIKRLLNEIEGLKEMFNA